MENLIFLDVEYANSKNKSICQIGILGEDFSTHNPIFPEQDIYINPEDKFDDFCIKVHGITNSDVQNKQNFPTIWKKIAKYFENAIIVGHNVANADINALVRNLKRYNIKIPDFYYICTLDLARKYVPECVVGNYQFSTLCDFFGIELDNYHNAFDDACACYDLFKMLIRIYKINDIEEYIKHYNYDENAIYFQEYVSESIIKKSIVDFYGILKGINIDDIITKKEAEYILKWKNTNFQYKNHIEISNIIKTIDEIFEDNVVTISEMKELQHIVEAYYKKVSANPVTLAIQTLNGILKGIIIDDKVTTVEALKLRKWIYENYDFMEHYPFSQILSVLEAVLEDNIITTEEANLLISIINDILNPVEQITQVINSVKNKHVCLSGTFEIGSKKDVEKDIIKNGGIIDKDLKKTTDFLIIGNCECQAYAHGSYGTKVAKAIDYNCKGCNIKIIKEKDFYTQYSKQVIKI